MVLCKCCSPRHAFFFRKLQNRYLFVRIYATARLCWGRRLYCYFLTIRKIRMIHFECLSYSKCTGNYVFLDIKFASWRFARLRLNNGDRITRIVCRLLVDFKPPPSASRIYVNSPCFDNPVEYSPQFQLSSPSSRVLSPRLDKTFLI